MREMPCSLLGARDTFLFKVVAGYAAKSPWERVKVRELSDAGSSKP